MVTHPIALRSPWYARERADVDQFDPRTFSPVIQKYDRDDFVRQIVDAPQDSLAYGPEDVWTFVVPRPAKTGAGLRELLSPWATASSGVRKLFQPSHQRFYAVTVELFCDGPGLPLPALADRVEVGFAIRRQRVVVRRPGDDGGNLRTLARLAASELFHAGFDKTGEGRPTLETARQIADLHMLHGADSVAFWLRHRPLIQRMGIRRVLEGWYVREDGSGSWEPVPRQATDPVPAGREQTFPMWRIPRPDRDCAPDPGRSLWFGLVPTSSADLDRAGRPRFDERTTYEISCVATRFQPAPKRRCPPLVTWSRAATEPYRLAAFFDPAGTANSRVHVRMPDVRALAAHVGSGGTAGGVVFERPAGSQFSSGPLGEFPQPGSGTVGGDVAENCFWAIELITIIAMFVMMLFKPIVIFVFQLWWMLLLKFCWPRPDSVNALINALATTSINGLSPTQAAPLSDLLGVSDDVRADITGPPGNPGAGTVTNNQARSRELVQSLQPQSEPKPPIPTPLPPAEDPYCRAPTTAH